jgi:type VI secretion system secreted protein VgrG
MPESTQKNRTLAVETPLGEDVLLLTSLTGQEEMSRLFHYNLEMLSERDSIAAKQIVGKNVTFSMRRHDGSFRYFNGFVKRFSGGALTRVRRYRQYRAEVVPWLWFLTRTADCRIFQSKKVPDIIKQIFGDLGFSDFALQLRGSYSERTYCVQYRETDFNFVSRLMEEEGIFYFFKHEKGTHTLVLADSNSAYPTSPEATLHYHPHLARDLKECLVAWEHGYEYRSGKWAYTDYNFETPSHDLKAHETSSVDLPRNKDFEVYDYPGEYEKSPEGTRLVKLRMEEEETGHELAIGTSGCRVLSPGEKFDLADYEVGGENGKSYVVTSIEHSAFEPAEYETSPTEEEVRDDPDYINHFQCIPASATFRPARITRRPVVEGLQTAVVVGPAGEEIYPDKYGRVKVQFHWDREGKRDENSSCWVRVSQGHAGKSWGYVDIPRIGEEVIVDFLEGDPDRPIITGRVYNAEEMPPYPLPGKKMVTGLKSNSTPGGGGYNEYIMDDTKGNELIREHGQFDKDSTIEHDLREHVKHDRHRDVTHDETTKIGHDRTETVANNEMIAINANRTETVDKDETITIHGNRTETVDKNETITINGGRTENVAKNESITIGGGRTESVAKDESISIGGGRTESVAKDESISINGGRTESVAKDESLTVGGARSESVGKSLTITAADAISIITGDASIVMKKDGTIAISGKDITITGSGQITGKASKDMVLKGQKILQN